ncbi:hypothetical protein M378DRAFT_163429 [Amanita muscaria Koide BX008]|uniref:Uncharacterized protein n=1 Tax=Amanita muscaria (strain Koide BX008) TaxID=946122 RepID=A0A0C2X635_AMAMK|nr:hypothetical protein M378DRAFT_163429 [Amanita muscaria Koide BX008]
MKRSRRRFLGMLCMGVLGGVKTEREGYTMLTVWSIVTEFVSKFRYRHKYER